jgi:hypothetical protein
LCPLPAHIEDSRSGSLSCERSESSADEDLISLITDCVSNTKDSRSGITTRRQRRYSLACWTNFIFSRDFPESRGREKIAGDQVTDCVDLFSIQEEADTIIILHALYADEQFGKSSVTLK